MPWRIVDKRMETAEYVEAAAAGHERREGVDFNYSRGLSWNRIKKTEYSIHIFRVYIR